MGGDEEDEFGAEGQEGVSGGSGGHDVGFVCGGLLWWGNGVGRKGERRIGEISFWSWQVREFLTLENGISFISPCPWQRDWNFLSLAPRLHGDGMRVKSV